MGGFVRRIISRKSKPRQQIQRAAVKAAPEKIHE